MDDATTCSPTASRPTGATCARWPTGCSARSARPTTPCRRRGCASAAPTADEVENLRAWLTTVVARVSLDMLRARTLAPRGAASARTCPSRSSSREDGVDPEHEALLADSVGLALLVVLETLAPPERLAFVLHDMFAVPFDEIAPIVGRSPAAARQLASRARRRVRGAAPAPDPDLDRQREVVEAFLAAARGGDFDALVALLDPDVDAPRRRRRRARRRLARGPRRGGRGRARCAASRRGPLRAAGARQRGGRVRRRCRGGRPVAVVGFTVARRPDRRDGRARRPGPAARAGPERACRLAAGGRSAARDRRAACGRLRRPRRSRPARRESSTPPRRTASSGDTENPLVRNARPIARARRTRSSAASCSDGPSPCASEPRCSRTPPACSRTKRAGRSLDMAAARLPPAPAVARAALHPIRMRRSAPRDRENRGMSSRDVLPIPDRQHVGLTTYDAKDPDTSYPADRAAASAGRRPQRARGPPRRRGLRLLLGLRRPVPDAGLRAPRRERAALQPLPHHGAVLADAPGAADRAQPPRRRHGRDHRDRDLGARLQLAAPEHRGAAGRDAQAQRLLDGAVRQVPRGAGVADEPDGAVRELALRRRRLRALLRLHRRGDQPVRAGDLRRHDPGGARSHAGGGLPLHRGHDRSRRSTGSASRRR